MQNLNRCMPFQSATFIKIIQALKRINKYNNPLIEMCVCFVCFVCLFVFWGFFFVPFENFSLIWRRHFIPVKARAANFDLCSTLINGVYNSHLQGPVQFTPIAELFTVELSLPVLTTWVCRSWDSNPRVCLFRRSSYNVNQELMVMGTTIATL